jgi:long-subunit acyl-CoA synthetase (AMP-forming)
MFHAINVCNHKNHVQSLYFLHTCIFAGELLHAINISKPCIIFCSEKAQECVDEVSRQAGFLKEIVTFGLPISHKHTPFISFLRDKSCSFQLPDINGLNLIAAILCSSGTTGLPKGVMLTQQNILSYMENVT